MRWTALALVLLLVGCQGRLYEQVTFTQLWVILRNLPLLLIVFALFGRVRRSKVVQLSRKKFPEVKTDDFEKWRKVELERIKTLLMTTAVVVTYYFLGVLASVTGDIKHYAGTDKLIFNLVYVAALTIGVYKTIRTAIRAENLRIDLGIKF